MTIYIGIIAFAFFFLSDYVKVKYKISGNIFFLTGSIGLVISTVLIFVKSFGQPHNDNFFITCLFGATAFMFLAFLFYTLFFTINIKEAYGNAINTCLCTKGVYALCRHPGILWFAGFYFSLSLVLSTKVSIHAFIIFTILDILYACYQDKCVFPVTIEGYNNYKKDTPFLIPTVKSIKNCFKTL